MDGGVPAQLGSGWIPPLAQAGSAYLVTILVVVVGAIVVLGLFWMMAPKKCPHCKGPLREMDPFKSGKTKKLRCVKCGKIVDTKIPVGRGRR
jgi:hypothetical protein